MWSMALGQKPSSSRVAVSSSSYVLLGKLLISLQGALVTLFIQLQIYLTLLSFSSRRMNTSPCSFRILMVQNYSSLVLFYLKFSLVSVLNTFRPYIFSNTQLSYSQTYYLIYFSVYPFSRFSISPRMFITFPFFITCFGNLFKNYSLEGGLKSLLSLDSKVLIAYEELSLLYFSATLSTTLKNTPFGYFSLRMQGKQPSMKSPRICRDYLDLQVKNLNPLIAIPLAKKPMGKGSAFLNL